MNGGLSFLKMHGLGNDFVVLDARARPLSLSPAAARAIAERRTGVGCDQVVVMEAPRDPDADVFMRIYNPDGGEAGACGNATRCVAHLMMCETGAERIEVETVSGLLDSQRAADGMVAVDMGPARQDWRDIPLAEAVDTRSLPIAHGPLSGPAAVSMGNPHAVFFVDDADAVDLAAWGPLVENDPLFPERTNVEVVQVISADRLRMRVWERGAGITRACGTGACAAVVAAAWRGLAGRRASVVLDGGVLEIDWMGDGHVMMTGPVAVSFSGTLDPSLLP